MWNRRRQSNGEGSVESACVSREGREGRISVSCEGLVEDDR